MEVLESGFCFGSCLAYSVLEWGSGSLEEDENRSVESKSVNKRECVLCCLDKKEPPALFSPKLGNDIDKGFYFSE